MAVALIATLFAVTSFAVVTGLGAGSVLDKVVEITTVDGVSLANPAAVLFTLASTYVVLWLGKTMEVLVISSLFAGLLAFQNSASRYFFAVGRSGTLPEGLSHVNRWGAPAAGSLATYLLPEPAFGDLCGPFPRRHQSLGEAVCRHQRPALGTSYQQVGQPELAQEVKVVRCHEQCTLIARQHPDDCSARRATATAAAWRRTEHKPAQP